MISHSGLSDLPQMQTSLGVFYPKCHWLCVLQSNALSQTFRLSLPPIPPHALSSQPSATPELYRPATTPPGTGMYFPPAWRAATFGQLLFFKSQLRYFSLCEVCINSSGQISLPSPLDPKIYGHLCVTLLKLRAFKFVFSTWWWDLKHKERGLMYMHVPSEWHIQCCWINPSSVYLSTNVDRVPAPGQARDERRETGWWAKPDRTPVLRKFAVGCRNRYSSSKHKDCCEPKTH